MWKIGYVLFAMVLYVKTQDAAAAELVISAFDQADLLQHSRNQVTDGSSVIVSGAGGVEAAGVLLATFLIVGTVVLMVQLFESGPEGLGL